MATTLTLKIRFSAEKCNGKSEYGEAIQLGQYVLVERQERGQMVELAIKPLSMPFRGITLCLRVASIAATRVDHGILSNWFKV